MSIYKVIPEDVESFTVVTNPIRHYVSSSTCGVTGSVHVFARRSSIEKEVSPLASFVEATHDDTDLASMTRSLQQLGMHARASGSISAYSQTIKDSFSNMLSVYLNKVNAQSSSVRKQKVLDVIRFTPSFDFTSNTMRKLMVKDQLSSYYRVSYPSAHWAYSNYNCLNFFTASTVPTSSVLLYPNIDTGPVHEGYVSGTYTPSGSVSFDFYINARYRPTNEFESFKAGTILHLSSTYALSLVTGTLRDENGLSTGFRLQLQLSHSADTAPSLASQGNYPNDLIFLSDDNALKWNNWHHVVVRWGTNLINDGTGSFNVDGVDKGTFVVPSSSIAPRLFSAGGTSSPDVLCVGNFFEGNNYGAGSMSRFFAQDTSDRDGLEVLDTSTGVEEPSAYSFNHPLNSELHDLSIKRYYMSDFDIVSSASVGPKSIVPGDVAFYLPPFFVTDSPFRKYVTDHGGILQTPFFEIDGTTDDPFNVALSFGVGGHYINIENFLRDFASNVFPRVHHMTGTVLSNTTDSKSANEFLYEQPSVVRRNLLLLPCDDGLFVPSFELLVSESIQTSYVDDLGTEEQSFIHLDNLIGDQSLLFGTDFGGGDRTSDQANLFVSELLGFTPEQPGITPGKAFLGYVDSVNRMIVSGTYGAGVQAGAPLTIFQRTRDPSSNQVTFFDVSNLYYGKRILPGSVELRDPSLSGSNGTIGITLRDDGRGTLYRSDSFTSSSTWNSVGTVFYDEGIIAIKSPHLYFFGKEDYELSFRGEQNVHVLKLDVLAPANQLNSSSNPCFKVVHPSGLSNDPEKEFVYISGLYLHDDNFNIVMKTQLAQPIMKRSGDKLMFSLKFDF